MAAQRRWIRLDADWEESGWLDGLTGEAAGCWPRILCYVKLRGSHGRSRRPAVTVVARRWRVRPESIEQLEEAAVADGALQVEDGDWFICNWASYQDVDPTAAVRKRRQRERETSRDVTDVTRDKGVTRRVTETGTMTKTKTDGTVISNVENLNGKKGRPTWLTPYWDPWVEHCGGEPAAGPMARELGKLRKGHDDAELVPAWTYYLAHTEPQFCSPASFRQKVGHWIKESKPVWGGYS